MQINEAKRLALEALERRSDAGVHGRRLVLNDDLTVERENAWVFAYDSEVYLRTGQREFRLVGNGPIYVDKRSGHVEFLGTYASREHVVADYEERLRGQIS